MHPPQTERGHQDDRQRWSRRRFLETAVAAGVVGSTARRTDAAMGAAGEQAVPDLEHRLAADNVYTRLLGVHPHLPAHGHATSLGGSRMPREVIQAMQEANDYFVLMDELMLAAGKRAAEVVKAEAAVITSGAASGLLLGAAACLTGTDEEKMRALPHPTWPRRECVIQKGHRYMYDRAMRSAGMTLVEVEGREQIVNALGDTTAMLFGIPRHGDLIGAGPDVVPPEELIPIGQRAGVPVMIDGASRLPPASHLTIYNELGADLVAISGGKGLRGPQSTGILSGRADLIEAAGRQAAPNDHIGRGMKVGKEEIIGLIAALNRYESLDHASVRSAWKAKADYIAAELHDVPGLDVAVKGEDEYEPYVELTWDEGVIPLSRKQVRETLMRRDDQRIGMMSLFGGNRIQTCCMRDGEEILVAKYLRTFFTEEAGGEGTHAGPEPGPRASQRRVNNSAQSSSAFSSARSVSPTASTS